MKPLGHKSYGSIGHLPGSRRGPGDHGVHEGQGNICTLKARDRHDRIIVSEKLDGSNVAVANVDGQFVALGRAGHLAISSPYEQHRLFADWLWSNLARFDFLKPGERIVGEWLAQAHGTRYALKHDPFVPFDLMFNGHERTPFDEMRVRVGSRFVMPHVLHDGGPCSIAKALAALDPSIHGAIDEIEGCVWRVERKGQVDFLAKYVRPNKIDGCYLPEITNQPPVWNWRPISELRP